MATESTNSLVFKTSKTNGKETIYVSIRLNDECKNGHQDFSITGDLYTAGKPKIDKYHLAGGCIHEDILKNFPEFQAFIKLHLCDYEGIPMYAVENGFYHLREGFNDEKTDSPNFEQKFCEYYRITPEQYKILATSKNKLQYALYLQNLGILGQWKEEANAAILHLEQLTGKKLLIDSKKTQFNAPTPEEIKEEEEKQENGYYTEEAAQQREMAKQAGIIEKLKAKMDKEISKATTEYEVKVQVLKIGGETALNNCIYYSHSNELAFNWKSYETIPQSIIDKIKNEIVLPAGVTIK